MKKGTRLAFKFIFWLIEIFAVWIFFMTAKTFDWKEDFFASIFVSLFGAYIISAIALIIVWIFNFLHEFNDVDSFSDGIKLLCFAPLFLVINIWAHFWNMLGYIKNLIFNRNFDDEDYSPAPSYSESPSSPVDYRSNTVFNKIEQLANNIIYSTPVDPFNKHKTYWRERPIVRVLLGRIEFTGTIVIENDTNSTYLEHRYADECINATKSWIKSEMSVGLEEIRSKYKGYDGNYRLNINLSYVEVGFKH